MGVQSRIYMHGKSATYPLVLSFCSTGIYSASASVYSLLIDIIRNSYDAPKDFGSEAKTLWGNNSLLSKKIFRPLFSWIIFITKLCCTCPQSEAPPPQPKEKKTPERTPADIVVAIYDFLGAEQGDLSLTKVFILFDSIIQHVSLNGCSQMRGNSSFNLFHLHFKTSTGCWCN